MWLCCLWCCSCCALTFSFFSYLPSAGFWLNVCWWSLCSGLLLRVVGYIMQSTDQWLWLSILYPNCFDWNDLGCSTVQGPSGKIKLLVLSFKLSHTFQFLLTNSSFWWLLLVGSFALRWNLTFDCLVSSGVCNSMDVFSTNMTVLFCPSCMVGYLKTKYQLNQLYFNYLPVVWYHIYLTAYSFHTSQFSIVTDLFVLPNFVPFLMYRHIRRLMVHHGLCAGIPVFSSWLFPCHFLSFLPNVVSNRGWFIVVFPKLHRIYAGLLLLFGPRCPGLLLWWHCRLLLIFGLVVACLSCQHRPSICSVVWCCIRLLGCL